MSLSPDGMGQAVIRNLRNRTGKSLDQWVRVAKQSTLTEPQALHMWLKIEYGFGGTTCVIISDATLGKPEPHSDSAMLDAQFRSERAAIRPAYDRLVLEVKKLGPDVSVGIRKTQTTFARTYSFTIAKAPTRTRIDLGLRIPSVKPTKRLEMLAQEGRRTDDH